MRVMGRSKKIYFFTLAGVILLSCLFLQIDKSKDIIRYHQHLEQPSEEELGECPVCGGKSVLCTHLPIIIINTGGKKIPGGPIMAADYSIVGYETSDNGEEQILVGISAINGEGIYNHLEDEPSVSAKALFRIRGNSSRRFDKKSYRIQFIDDTNPDKKKDVSVLGMPADMEWALHGPFLDKTLIRNYMWMNISAEVMGYAPNVRFCELILDGEYQGVYVLMETIREGENRINLTDYEKNSPVCSYMVRFEPKSNPNKVIDNFTYYTKRLEEGTKSEVIYPGANEQTEDVKKYIKSDLNEIEQKLFSQEFKDEPDSCWNYLDMDSFVNYYILQEFLAVNDVFSASTYMYKDVRGKLHIGPVWDYNNVLDNFLREMPQNEFLLSQRGWYSQLMRSEKFVKRLIARYRELREGYLSEEYLVDYVMETQKWLGSAVERNFEVWGYSFDVNQIQPYEMKRPFGSKRKEQPVEELNPTNYEEATQWMLEYMKGRGRWMDNNIDSLLQYCHPSKNSASALD